MFPFYPSGFSVTGSCCAGNGSLTTALRVLRRDVFCQGGGDGFFLLCSSFPLLVGFSVTDTLHTGTHHETKHADLGGFFLCWPHTHRCIPLSDDYSVSKRGERFATETEETSEEFTGVWVGQEDVQGV